MHFGFGMRLTPLAGFGPVLGYSRERGFCLRPTIGLASIIVNTNRHACRKFLTDACWQCIVSMRKKQMGDDTSIQKLGGDARAAKLSIEERRRIARHAAEVRW